jgi:hypothetical protein
MKTITSLINFVSWQCYILQYGPTLNQHVDGVDINIDKLWFPVLKPWKEI